MPVPSIPAENSKNAQCPASGSSAFAAGGVLPYADRYVHAFHLQYAAMRAEPRA